MLCSTRTLGSALKFPSSRSISFSKANLRLPQAIRCQSRWTSAKLLKNRPHHSILSFTAPTPFIRECLIPLGCLSESVRRSYATSSPSRVRKFGGLVFKLSLAGVILLICVAGVNYWSLLHPAQLAKWPEELRRDLVEAGLAQEAGVLGRSLESLTRAWRTIQSIPMDALKPDPSVKILSVAIWLADVLERDHQALKAYNVLTDAVALHQVRSQKAPPTLDGAPEYQTTAGASGSFAERRHLISVFLKLASLSESCEPSAEGKWLSSAIREMMVLLPLCQAIPIQRFASMISSVQDLSIYDTSFSGLSAELNTQPTISADPSDSSQVKSSSGPDISIDDLIGEEAGLPVPLPKWAMPDVASAIAIPFEQVGLYAEKRARTDIAYPAYCLASDTILGMTCTPALAPEDVNMAYWEALVRVHRILNRQTDIQLRFLESETHPTEWLYRLHEANKANMSAEAVGTAVIEILNDKGKKEWAPILRKIVDPFLEYGVEMAISLRHKGIRLEKLGEMEEAMACFQNSLLLLRSGECPLEINKAQECMKTAQQNLAEGKTTLRSQMNPLALKEWKEMERARLRVPEETQVSEPGKP